jgi:hypothetical protein
MLAALTGVRSMPRLFLAAAALLLAAPAFAATTATATATLDPSLQAQDPCRAEVSKFEQAIGFIRQSQGNQAASELKEKLLPAKLENEILFRDGYCGLAKYIRDRKLNR